MPACRCGPLLAALISFGFCSSAVALERVPADLLGELNAWIDDHTDLPRREDQPKIEFVPESMLSPPEELATLIGTRTAGLFDPKTGRILLTEPWSPGDARNVSVLLHELIHFRQEGAGYWRCAGARELPAYKAQDSWLRERGLKADVSWIAVVLASSCSLRDHHP